MFGAAVTNVSVIGLYATFVLAIGRFVRIFFDKISQRVIYEEMPNTDDLFDLCEGKMNIPKKIKNDIILSEFK